MKLKDKILELREQKLSYNEIAKRLGCSKGTISFHCKNSNKNEPVSQSQLKIFEEIGEEEEKKIRFLTEEKGYYHTEVADALRLPRKVVCSFVLSRKIKRKRSGLVGYPATRNHYRKIKYLSVEYKGGKCEICGYNKCIAALDFHHIDPAEKEFSLSSAKKSWLNTKKELDKCILLCSNCHREIHYSFE